MRFFISVLCFVVLFMFGCSSGSPTVPVSEESIPNPVNTLDNLPIISGTINTDGSFHAIGLMGGYELTIDPANASAELVSMRVPTLGQSWIVSGIGFFTIVPCSSCLQLVSIALTAENYLRMEFQITHPFKPGNTSLPPSATNRLDLDVFDVALVIQPIGATPTDYSLIGTDAYAGILALNPGYTTELTNVTGDRAALPYALVVDDSVSGGSTFNEFPMGADSFFDVFFDLNTITTFTFDLYLTMGYGASAQGKAQRLTPTYFNPEFNRKSAWKIDVTPPQGSDPPAMGNTWDDNDNATPYTVTVTVFDWQQGVTSIANPPVNTGDIAFASNVSKVAVEIPGMTSTLPEVTTPTSGTGSPSDPLIFEVTFANENLLDDGEYMGLVKVSDERVPETTPTAIDFLIDCPDGVTLTNFAIPEFATYQTFIATVVIGNTPPTADLSPVTTTACPNSTVLFDASGSTDAQDPLALLTFEWDWDYGTGPFTSDTGPPSSSPTATSAPYAPPGPYTAAVRVTDSGGLTDIDTANVFIDRPPVANLSPAAAMYCPNGVVNFDASGSSDMEDPLADLTFEWDWDYGTGPFSSDTGPPSSSPTRTSPPYAAPGPYVAAVRVTDTCGSQDIDTSTVTLGDGPPAPDNWTTDVTDGSTITNVLYYHTLGRIGSGSSYRGRAYGTEGTAYGNGYVYMTFYTSTGSLYFTRSNNAGQTWDTPTAILTGVTNLQDATIDAVGSTVIIGYAEEVTSTVHVLKNTNSGAGAWTDYLVADFTNGWYILSLSVAIDPVDTNYLYAVYNRQSSISNYGFYNSWIATNTSGGSGAWTETLISWNPQTGNNQYSVQVDVHSDRAVYLGRLWNSYVALQRSDNYGVTFTPGSYNTNYFSVPAWGADMDMCLHPTNANVVYIAYCIANNSSTYNATYRIVKTTNRATTCTLLSTNYNHAGTTVVCRQPAIMVDSNNTLAIAYTSYVNASDYDIYVRQSCDGDDTDVGAAVKMNVDDTGLDVDPELSLCSPLGGMVLTWDENGYASQTTDNPSGKIVARHLN